jgi:hypothetical protein
LTAVATVFNVARWGDVYFMLWGHNDKTSMKAGT